MSDYIIVDGELYHHGVKGMRWGHRKSSQASGQQAKKNTKTKDQDSEKKTVNPNRKREIAIAATAVVGTALAAYGAHKLSTVIKDRAYKNAMERGRSAMERYIDNFGADKPYTILERMHESQQMAYESTGRSAVKAITSAISNNYSRGHGVDWKRVYANFK